MTPINSPQAAKLNLAILMGGPSAEADVSRSSAKEVANALSKLGHAVTCHELAANVGAALALQQPDVVFPVLHGPPGEDGTVQGFLDILDYCYVGSGVVSSAAAMDKTLAKHLYRAAGLPLAEDLVLPPGQDPAAAAQDVLAKLGERVVVKPNQQGSAIGVTRVTQAAALEPAIREALASGNGALVEAYIEGKEITVGVIDLDGEQPAAFPVIEVRTAQGEWYDFHNRYAVGSSDHIIPAELPARVNETLQSIALQAHQLLGLRDLSRSDFIVAPDNSIVLLETNTLPGMTPTSLYPDGANAFGLNFEALMQALVHSALSRGRPSTHGRTSAAGAS